MRSRPKLGDGMPQPQQANLDTIDRAHSSTLRKDNGPIAGPMTSVHGWLGIGSANLDRERIGI
jgi:hypothetical protein